MRSLRASDWLWSFLFWTPPAIVSALHVHVWDRGHVSLALAAVSEIPPWYAVAAVTPLILAFMMRFPLRWAPAPARVLLHAAVYSLTILFVGLVFGATYQLRHPSVPYPVLVGETMTGFLATLVICFTLLNREAVNRLQTAASREAEQQRSRLAVQLANAQVQVVESQLQPHFLFNTLDGVVSLVRSGDRDLAARALVLLSELLRSLLSWRTRDEIDLGEELHFIRSYLSLMSLRFEGRLTIEWVLEPGLESLRVPPLVFHPLVENAFKHGLEVKRGRGLLRLGARRVDSGLELFVEDDGPGPTALPSTDEAGGLGLSGTRLRLAEHYGDAATLTLSARPEGGARSQLRLPTT